MCSVNCEMFILLLKLSCIYIYFKIINISLWGKKCWQKTITGAIDKC